MSKEMIELIWSLHYSGYFNWEIAKKLNISEAEVVSVLGE